MTFAIIAGVVYLTTVVGFLILFDRMRKLDAQQQDLLLERIQRPEQRPVTPIPFDPKDFDDPESRTDLGEMAAIGMVNPTGLTPNRDK